MPLERQHFFLIPGIALSTLLVVYFYHKIHETQAIQKEVGQSLESIPFRLRNMKRRDELGNLVFDYKLYRTAEVGVRDGTFSETLVGSTGGPRRLHYMVDLWAHQSNYKDSSNFNNDEHFQNKVTSIRRMAFFMATEGNLRVMQMSSLEAAKHIPDNSLDFIYIDARHDYCGVMEDLQAWWPKLRPGGVFAGHDFRTADEMNSWLHGNFWNGGADDYSLCEDGTQNSGGVKGAVLDFYEMHKAEMTPVESTTEPDWFPVNISWMTTKKMALT